MEGNRKRITAIEIVGMLFFLAALTGTLVSLAAGDTMILYFGIRIYRILRSVMLVLLIVSAVIVVLCILRRVSYARKDLEKRAEQQVEMEETLREKKRRDAKLSVKGELDAAAIREMLVEKSKGRWSFAYELIYECVEQMEQMDSYQERLKKLLQNNGAESLNDTEDVLNQVEQYICKNVRNVLNFMDVADDDAADQIRVKLLTCKEENQNLLTQTRDFIYALAEFLNDQGGKADTRLLETYRTTILQSITKSASDRI